MLENKGKEEFVEFLTSKGFAKPEDIYSAVSEFFKTQISEGNSIRFKGVFALRAKKLPPRTFKDNLNKKEIQFGERIKHGFKNLIKDKE